MEVLAAVAPAADVDAADVGDRAHRPLDPGEQNTEIGGAPVREVAGLRVVLARLEHHDHGQPGRAKRPYAPMVVRPEVVLVGSGATPAVDAAFAVPRGVAIGRRLQLARTHLAVEGESLPVLDGRHPQLVFHPLVELFRALGHRLRRW